ncbi:MAG: c-type cytochrome domain-containing protein [Verrucomicrobiota bacterium]
MAIQTILDQHCLDCHTAPDPDGKLLLDDFTALMNGGESGASIVPGNSEDSLIVKMIEGRIEREGKKKIMPPGKRAKLKPEEIALVRAWIDAGAKAPAVAQSRVRELNVPKILPKVPPRKSINALAYASAQKLVAVARIEEIELRRAESRSVQRTLPGHRGPINALVFTADGAHLFAAGGQPGLFGEVRQWKTSDGTLIRTMEGHSDAIYALALSPDGKMLATGSYDQKIQLWNPENGQLLKTLSGHNGCIFDLAFRPDGKILASASADRTVKLWDVLSGERRDTLSQPLKEQYAVAFSANGKKLYAGGADNRIRVWEISEKATETTNPILEAKYAHEGAVLDLVFSTDGKLLASSADDRTVKLWDPAGELKEKLLLPQQPDWPRALAFVLENKALAIGRLDGSVEFYDSSKGEIKPPGKPQLAQLQPRGIQRGVTSKITLTGSNLGGVEKVKFNHEKISATISKQTNGGEHADHELLIEVTPDGSVPREAYELWVEHAGGESGKLKFWVDDLPAISEVASSDAPPVMKVPATFWGTLSKPGEIDGFTFSARAGEQLVFDAAAQTLGSKANLLLMLYDASGALVASNNGFDGGDPLMEFRAPFEGNYVLRATDRTSAGSPEHFYRISVGQFPFVTSVYPLGVAAGAPREIALIGFNLGESDRVQLNAEKPGELLVPINAEKYRSRRPIKILVTNQQEILETEPNHSTEQAGLVSWPVIINGRIQSAEDTDLFRFEVKAGQHLLIETAAASLGSPIDTRLEVCHADGKAVQRLMLQAVRDSRINFRGIDSNATGARLDNYLEMELNEFLYLQGEVVKLFRMPQGPDSEMVFYTMHGKRRLYFDTSPSAHALDENCYIVEPHPPGTKPLPNGLPTFPVFYANDDDADRKLGTDSKIHFTAPADGAYLVRVTDTRAFGGDRFSYRLSLREPKPDFVVRLNGAHPTVPLGSGREFSLTAERLDGFEGEIVVEVSGLPPGFVVTSPLTIQAGHLEAKGTLFAMPNAPAPAETNAPLTKIVASAVIDGKNVRKEIDGFGKIKLGEKPKVFVALEQSKEGVPQAWQSEGQAEMRELHIEPGQTIPAWLKIKRNGHEELVTFTVENLPHGIIVDNIGLNGVLIPKGENEREIFLYASKWVPETDRMCYAVENQAGRQTSFPVLLKVRKRGAPVTASAP